MNLLTPAKILLFGEFTTINGGDALAMPLKLFQGQWKQGNDSKLQRDLSQFFTFLKKLNIYLLLEIIATVLHLIPLYQKPKANQLIRH